MAVGHREIFIYMPARMDELATLYAIVAWILKQYSSHPRPSRNVTLVSHLALNYTADDHTAGGLCHQVDPITSRLPHQSRRLSSNHLECEQLLERRLVLARLASRSARYACVFIDLRMGTQTSSSIYSIDRHIPIIVEL